MRIERLDLLAFGPFTGRELDLGGPGLQVVYGPNEAGKSSARAALTDLLYGIATRTPYDFVHPKSSIRLGARLVDAGGQALEVIRYKRRNHDLVDASTEEPVDPERWAALLAGASRADYAALYTLDRHELVERTAELVRHGGRVGEALFGAGLGGTRVGAVLEQLDGQAAELFRPRGRLQRVNRLLAEAESARREQREATVLPNHYQTVRRDFDRAAAEHEALGQRRRGARAAHDRLLTLRAVFPVLAGRQGVIEARRNLAAERKVQPADWGERVKHLLEDRTRLVGDQAAARQRRRQEQEILDGLLVERELLEQAAAIRALAEDIGRFETDRHDRAGLEEGRIQAEAGAELVLASLAGGGRIEEVRAEAERVLPGHPSMDAARQAWSDARRDRLGAEGALEAARRELDGLFQQRRQLGADVDPAALRAAFGAARRLGDVDARVAAARAAVGRLGARTRLLAARLGVLVDAVDQVVGQPGPSEEAVGRVAEEVGESAGAAARCATRAEECAEQARQRADELARMAGTGAPPSPEEVAARREARDAAWSAVRAWWLEEVAPPSGQWTDQRTLADQVEAAQAAADQASDQLWRQAERVEQARRLRADVAELTAQEARSRADAVHHRQVASDTYQQWRQAWPAQVTSASFEGLRAHLVLLEELRVTHREAGDLAIDLAETEGLRRTHRQSLGEMLGLPAAPGDQDAAAALLAPVLERAEAELARREELHRQLGALDRREDEVRSALPGLERRTEAEAEAEAEARQALAQLLGAFADQAGSPDEARPLLERLGQLAGFLQARTDRRERIRGIDRRSRRFLEALAALGEPESAGAGGREVSESAGAGGREPAESAGAGGREVSESAGAGGREPANPVGGTDAGPGGRPGGGPRDVAPDGAGTGSSDRASQPGPGEWLGEWLGEGLDGTLDGSLDGAAAAAAAARALRRRLEAAELAAAAEEAHRRAEQEAGGDLQEATNALAGIQAQLALAAAEAELDDVEQLGTEAARALEAAELDLQRQRFESQLEQQAPGRSPDELAEAAGSRDLADLDAEVHESTEAMTALDAEVDAAAERRRELRQQLAAMDGSAQAAEAAAAAERATSSAVEEGEQCARLLLARLVADEAIGRFREQNQDPVLAGAGRFLDRLTAGRYVAVGAGDDLDPGPGRTTDGGLAVRGADGTDKTVDQLSTGLADQLWLALRLAAIESAVQRRGPLPVVVDDVLVNFDDQRSAAALQALAALGRSTQVLLFTHHRQVAETARHQLGSEQAAVRTL